MVSLIISCCFGFIGMILIVFMNKVKIKDKKRRKQLVSTYKISTKISLVFMVLSMMIMVYNFYIFQYKIIYIFINTMSENINFSKYVSLTLLLVSIEPITFFILKSVKRKLFKENEKYKELQGTGTELINKIIRTIDKLPVKGLIHIINLVLVILANSFKLFSIESGVTTSSIYMSIATFYALDKVIEYFLKKYSMFWKSLDNKIFKTDIIDASIQFSLNDLENTKISLFDRYIESGKYGLEG